MKVSGPDVGIFVFQGDALLLENEINERGANASLLLVFFEISGASVYCVCWREGTVRQGPPRAAFVCEAP